MQLRGRAYDILKWFVVIVLPAIAALYFALGQIWGLPKPTEVVGSITIITTFLGTILGISTVSYNRGGGGYDGSIVVTTTEDKKTYSLELDGSPEDLDQKGEVKFKVVPKS
jgi:hypothetical protein